MPQLTQPLDRKSTRLNSSHTVISYAVFCLKKKKKAFEIIQQNKKNTTNVNKQSDVFFLIATVVGLDHHFGWRPLHFFGDLFFFFNDTATTEIYTLSLHDALPI